ncbi:MAG: hypothetical protein ACO22Y_06210, partial [Sediminibacterium sp.]
FTMEKVSIMAAMLIEVAAIESFTIKLVLLLLFWKLILFAISKAVFKWVIFFKSNLFIIIYYEIWPSFVMK